MLRFDDSGGAGASRRVRREERGGWTDGYCRVSDADVRLPMTAELVADRIRPMATELANVGEAPVLGLARPEGNAAELRLAGVERAERRRRAARRDRRGSVGS